MPSSKKIKELTTAEKRHEEQQMVCKNKKHICGKIGLKFRKEVLTLQRGVTSAVHHGENITCRGVTSTARHATLSHSFDYISTT
jgi:hypothetical protein